MDCRRKIESKRGELVEESNRMGLWMRGGDGMTIYNRREQDRIEEERGKRGRFELLD